MLANVLLASWLLSSLSSLYSVNSQSTSLLICNINGAFAIGDECPSDSGSLKLQNESAITHASTASTIQSSGIASVTLSSSTSTTLSSSVSATSSPAKTTEPASSSQTTKSTVSNSPLTSSTHTTKSASFTTSTTHTTSSGSTTKTTKSSTTSSKPPKTSSSSVTHTSSTSTKKSSSTTSATSPKFTRPIIGNAPPAKAGPLTLTKLYQGEDFINEFDFFSSPDPTHGNVNYLNQQDAISQGLIQVKGNTTILKVDDTTQLQPGQNRNSIRISSQMRMTGGLLIGNFKAMPTGCSVWPAFWAVGDNWPNNGEIDIIEGVNRQTQNQITLHTAPGCTRDDAAKPAPGQSKAFTGTPLQASCDVTVNSNSGCGIMDTGKDSFGVSYNNNGGGVVATTWDELGIRIWMFPNGSVPPDITAMAPVPGNWPVPDAFFSSVTCPVDQYFANMMIVFDITLCGDFAEALFPSSGCPGTCAGTVQDPNNYKQANWTIEYVAIYN